MALKRAAASFLGIALSALFLPAADPDKVLAIRGGTVLTMAGAPLVGGTVVVRNGKIDAVGIDPVVPAGAEVLDASGRFVLPGLIDAMTSYGIRPADLNDVSNPSTPEHRVRHVFAFAEARGLLEGGVTTIYIAPGNRQVIGGQGAVVKTCGDRAGGPYLLEPAGLDMTLGDPVKSQFGQANRTPSTRMAIAASIRRTFQGGRDHAEKLSSGNGTAAGAPPDPAMDAVAKALRRELPVRVEADRPDDIRTALRIAREFGLRIVIDGGGGASDVAETLAAAGVPVVLGPVSHARRTGGAVPVSSARSEETASLLEKAGVKFALASFGGGQRQSGDAAGGRWLLLEAALATAFGLSEEAALKAVTISAAEILGVADRVGSLETGKHADILILDRPPLDLKSRVVQVIIDGRLVVHE